MWYKNRITDLVGIQYPVWQGPFGGGLSTVQLTSTVSRLGGLGGFGAYTLSPQEIYDTDRQIRAETDKPYNLNLWVSDHDITDAGHTERQYKKAVEIFRPYFDRLGIDVPAPPVPFESRFQNQLQAVSRCKAQSF